MANYLTDDAICLRVTDFSETSQVVGLFTRRHGLVPMIAKGAKRQTKKNSMSGPLDLLTSGEVVFVPAKGAAELAILSGWELVNQRTKLRGDLAALNGAMICAEVTTMLLVAHDPHEALFEELEAALELMGMSPPYRMRGLVSYVKAALEEAGYGAALEKCLVCGRNVQAEEMMRFCAGAGGVVCEGCEPPAGRVVNVPGRIVIALERLGRPRELLGAAERAAEPEALARAMELLLTQLESVTDREVKTRYLVGSVLRARS